MGKRQPLQWCRELHYLNRESVKTIAKPKTHSLLQTFPGHYVLPQPNHHKQPHHETPEKRKNPTDEEIKIVPESVLPPPSSLKENDTPANLVPAHLANTKLLPKGLTALASFPGSGNTWLRYLLQQATGK